MEFANLLDMLERRVAALMEEVAALRLVAEEAKQLRAENTSLHEQLENERQIRISAADRLGVLVEQLDQKLAQTEEAGAAQKTGNGAQEEAHAPFVGPVIEGQKPIYS